MNRETEIRESADGLHDDVLEIIYFQSDYDDLVKNGCDSTLPMPLEEKTRHDRDCGSSYSFSDNFTEKTYMCLFTDDQNLEKKNIAQEIPKQDKRKNLNGFSLRFGSNRSKKMDEASKPRTRKFIDLTLDSPKLDKREMIKQSKSEKLIHKSLYVGNKSKSSREIVNRDLLSFFPAHSYDHKRRDEITRYNDQCSHSHAVDMGPMQLNENRWACDHCCVSYFSSYEEACAHEETCLTRDGICNLPNIDVKNGHKSNFLDSTNDSQKEDTGKSLKDVLSWMGQSSSKSLDGRTVSTSYSESSRNSDLRPEKKWDIVAK
eukprot:CAMPEP_0194229918 /NCGR_PEP_ID=MMETSP0156-20130528/44142_1 /TAXON_ID=33649 /ORGANISM="Thalassionema nitzschioides, Strain L26-B" /LENGTH=316 /DNA_ID=CAMNT_0038962483 /DNA_START=33 /DNA_END=980 /DNA_ORIENTATION=-